MMTDRTIHATLSNGDEIVRYNRAGKWYREGAFVREHISFDVAVAWAKTGTVYLGKPGGSRFDLEVQR